MRFRLGTFALFRNLVAHFVAVVRLLMIYSVLSALYRSFLTTRRREQNASAASAHAVSKEVKLSSLCANPFCTSLLPSRQSTCPCRLAAYCSEQCQKQHWRAHEAAHQAVTDSQLVSRRRKAVRRLAKWLLAASHRDIRRLKQTVKRAWQSMAEVLVVMLNFASEHEIRAVVNDERSVREFVVLATLDEWTQHFPDVDHCHQRVAMSKLRAVSVFVVLGEPSAGSYHDAHDVFFRVDLDCDVDVAGDSAWILNLVCGRYAFAPAVCSSWV